MSKSFEIVIPRTGGGQLRHINSPEATALSAKLGQQQIKRASHVEPGSGLRAEARVWLLTQVAAGEFGPIVHRDPHCGKLHVAAGYANKWFADLTPVAGPVLGPYDNNDLALQAELAWLHEHSIPAPK